MRKTAFVISPYRGIAFAAMITYWTNFARNHDPNAEGLTLLDEYVAWRRQ